MTFKETKFCVEVLCHWYDQETFNISRRELDGLSYMFDREKHTQKVNEENFYRLKSWNRQYNFGVAEDF